MTTFLGVWHQSLALTARLLRGRRGVRGGASRLHCAVLPVRGLTGPHIRPTCRTEMLSGEGRPNLVPASV
eukprot:scaffold49923_cov84-Phaeocystis_antarctica.AAC.2